MLTVEERSIRNCIGKIDCGKMGGYNSELRCIWYDLDMCFDGDLKREKIWVATDEYDKGKRESHKCIYHITKNELKEALNELAKYTMPL